MRFFLFSIAFLPALSTTLNTDSCPKTENNEDWINQVFDIDIDSVKNIILSDIPWQKQLEKYVIEANKEVVIRRASAYNMTEWSNSTNGLERHLSYEMHPNSTFVSTSNVNEKQTFISDLEDSFIIRRDIANSGFPFADTFQLEVFFCAFSIAENMSTHIIARNDIKSTSSWYFIVSATVEEGTREGMIEYYSAFSDALNLYAKERLGSMSTTSTAELLRAVSSENAPTPLDSMHHPLQFDAFDGKDGGAISPGNVDARLPMTSQGDTTVAPFLSGMSEADIIENYVQFTDRISVTDGVDVLRIGALFLVVILVIVLLLAHKKLFSMVRTVPQIPLAVISMKNLDTDPLLTTRSASTVRSTEPSTS